jgi:hypothetical protein
MEKDDPSIDVRGPDGRPMTVELLDEDVRGNPWRGVGYRAALLVRGKRRVRGYVHWLGGAWRFTASTR